MVVKLENIICTTDFSDFANNAIPFAVMLAAEFGTKLYISHVIDIPAAAMYGEALIDPHEIQNRIDKYAHDQISVMVGDEDLECEPLITIGHPAEEIARLTAEKNVSLVISAAHGRSGLERLILGSVTERMMHTLTCPLLVIPEPKADQGKDIRFKRILVGCDFSHDSDLAVDYGLYMAQSFQAEVHLAHVIEPDVFKDLIKPGGNVERERREFLKNELQEKLAAMIPDDAHNWCHPSTEILAGQPHEELSKFAVINNIDLIVLGVHGRGFVENLLVGSTTDRVIRMGAAPVMAVRPVVRESSGAA